MQPQIIDLTKIAPGVVLKLNIGDILNAPYSGSVIPLNLPKGKYKLETWGAQGGYRNYTTNGGRGGCSSGILNTVDKIQLFLYTGGQGNGSNGFNGGGRRYVSSFGGGASDIRIEKDNLLARVIVAGGGGSDGDLTKGGGYGGGINGQSRTESYGSGSFGGAQVRPTNGWVKDIQTNSTATITDAYAGFGFGGNGVYYASGHGGAGGGGWWGGSGTYPDGSGDDDRGGGGGSGYIYNSANAINYPVGCLLNSSYYLDSGVTTAGNISFTSPTGTAEVGHSGDGYIRITIIEIENIGYPALKIDNIWKKTTNLFIKNNDIWKTATAIYIKQNGIWKETKSIDLSS